MLEFYTLVILIITRLGEFGEKQLLVFSSRRGANWALNAGSSFICVFFFMKMQISCSFVESTLVEDSRDTQGKVILLLSNG